jgi:Pvc16 N-terminal domain
MIDDLDESLRTIVQAYGLNGSGVDLAFDAPTTDWAAKRSGPAVNLYLYDIREDLERRNVAYEKVIDENGRTTGRRPPPRRFALSYLITAWTQRPEDEHRLLSRLLLCFLRMEALPNEMLQGDLKEQPFPILVEIGLPPPDDRSISELWTALGGELKPSLDLVVTVPFDTGREQEAGPPVLEEPRIVLPDAAETAAKPRPKGRGTRRRAAEPAEPPATEPAVEADTVAAGTEKQPGRVLRVRPKRPGQDE